MRLYDRLWHRIPLMWCEGKYALSVSSNLGRSPACSCQILRFGSARGSELAQFPKFQTIREPNASFYSQSAKIYKKAVFVGDLAVIDMPGGPPPNTGPCIMCPQPPPPAASCARSIHGTPSKKRARSVWAQPASRWMVTLTENPFICCFLLRNWKIAWQFFFFFFLYRHGASAELAELARSQNATAQIPVFISFSLKYRFVSDQKSSPNIF